MLDFSINTKIFHQVLVNKNFITLGFLTIDKRTSYIKHNRNIWLYHILEYVLFLNHIQYTKFLFNPIYICLCTRLFYKKIPFFKHLGMRLKLY